MPDGQRLSGDLHVFACIICTDFDAVTDLIFMFSTFSSSGGLLGLIEECLLKPRNEYDVFSHDALDTLKGCHLADKIALFVH